MIKNNNTKKTGIASVLFVGLAATLLSPTNYSQKNALASEHKQEVVTTTTFSLTNKNIVDFYNIVKYDGDLSNGEEGTPRHQVGIPLVFEEVKKTLEKKVKTKPDDTIQSIAKENSTTPEQVLLLNKSNDVFGIVGNITEGVEIKVGDYDTYSYNAYRIQKIKKQNKISVNKGEPLVALTLATGRSIKEIVELNPDKDLEKVTSIPNDMEIVYEEYTIEEKVKLSIMEARKEIDSSIKKAVELDRIEDEEIAKKNALLEAERLKSGQKSIDIAKTQLGVPYVWGGTTPNVGLDCSGLTQYVFRTTYGVEIGRVTTQQENSGEVIPIENAQAGDLFFWGAKGSTHHVALSTGNGGYIHAPQPGEVVKVGSVQAFKPSFAVRVNK